MVLHHLIHQNQNQNRGRTLPGFVRAKRPDPLDLKEPEPEEELKYSQKVLLFQMILYQDEPPRGFEPPKRISTKITR